MTDRPDIYTEKFRDYMDTAQAYLTAWVMNDEISQATMERIIKEYIANGEIIYFIQAFGLVSAYVLKASANVHDFDAVLHLKWADEVRKGLQEG